jgi:hypothetical protein
VSRLRLIVQALGGPAQLAGKLRRLAGTVALYAGGRGLAARLERLRARGYLDSAPSRAQLLFGGLDMVRFVIAPAARVYYADKRVSRALHNLLRFVDDPVAGLDPTGLLSARDTTIGHLLQVVHLGCCDPVYDLQVLESFDDGLDELDRQLRALLDGTHPRGAAIAAIIADPTYHRRLLDYLVAFRAGRPPRFCETAPLLDDGDFAAAQETFATLAGFLHYAAALPTSPLALARRLVTVTRFPGSADRTGRSPPPPADR